MAPRDTGIGLKPSLTWPAIRSVVSGCDALYGMNWTLRPACADEHLGGEMADRADTGQADLIGLLGTFDQRDHILDGLRRHAGIGEQQRRSRRDQAERREILAHVVAGGRHHGRAGRERRGVPQHDGVAVRRAFRDGARGDGAAAAERAVFHHHRLTEQRGHLFRHQTREDVGGAARRQRHDQGDGTGRIGLRLREAACGCQDHSECGCRETVPPGLPTGHFNSLHTSADFLCKSASASPTAKKGSGVAPSRKPADAVAAMRPVRYQGGTRP